jgi:two-component system, chemotaxis family, protein-glutamate methylesterase/glutaminase
MATQKRDIVVVGASAGGLEALKLLLAGLPVDFPAAMLIVWHIAPQSINLLPGLLGKEGRLPVAPARDGGVIKPGHVYVAIPNRHLLITADGRMRVAYGPKENRFRPAVDALFRSAAQAFGPRVIGVVLTGMLDDGTAGLWAVKDRGGLAVVQDPTEAAYPSMPQTAAEYVSVDAMVPMAEMAATLVELTARPLPAKAVKAPSPALELENKIAHNRDALSEGILEAGELSAFTCPECQGSLVQLHGGGIPRFRCHTGHAFSIHSLLAEASDRAEQRLWTAARALEENGLMMRHLAEHLSEKPAEQERAATLQRKAALTEKTVMELRRMLERVENLDPVPALSRPKPRRAAKNGAKKTKAKPARRPAARANSNAGRHS